MKTALSHSIFHWNKVANTIVYSKVITLLQIVLGISLELWFQQNDYVNNISLSKLHTPYVDMK